ncbi:putative DEAD/DEAH box helicase [Plasmodium gaboni]|uniref:Putative DEAD/DEAH box helicase n=1 Tax=Plasmodium gaboni TaxID=647221 RepID=A0A151LIN8_9APIC|nr:putative DEAD/DEAH box helicase [Plasmodium gaboni]KYN98709.1 putative DEAD/DEAH box helicase [Plasmodium gaboni]
MRNKYFLLHSYNYYFNNNNLKKPLFLLQQAKCLRTKKKKNWELPERTGIFSQGEKKKNEQLASQTYEKYSFDMDNKEMNNQNNKNNINNINNNNNCYNHKTNYNNFITNKEMKQNYNHTSNDKNTYNVTNNNNLKHKYEEMKKKLYKKYNYHEIESDPHNIYKYDDNYENINELNIHKMLLLGLQNIHINELNKMQINSFLTIQQGKDTIINYPDGSGKTIAYLLPILNNLYFLHDYLEQIILDSYNEKESGASNKNLIEKNYKFNNNFNLNNEINNYLLKYSHYKNNVFFKDNTLDISNKLKNKKFDLLPSSFDETYKNKYIQRIGGRKSKCRKKNKLDHFNGTSLTMDNNKNELVINNISIMNKLIEIIKINNIKLSNLNSDYTNEEELKKLDNIIKYNIINGSNNVYKNKNDENKCVKDNYNEESIYRYLTLNPLQINKTVVILTINKDNISQIINVIKKLDILKRINIQTLNDVPYSDHSNNNDHMTDEQIGDDIYNMHNTHTQTHKRDNKYKRASNNIHDENVDNDYYVKNNIKEENYNLENLEVSKVTHIDNPVLCNDEIMWTYADILITTPDIFLNSYKNNNKISNKIIPSIIIFDEIDMLFQNNAYRNTMMNIFQIIKKRPEIYNPHIDISNHNIDIINESIDNALIDKKGNVNEYEEYMSKNIDTHNNNSNDDTCYDNYNNKYVRNVKNDTCDVDLSNNITNTCDNINTFYKNKNYNKRDKKDKKEDAALPLIQLIYVSSTLPSVGPTTAGSMLTERFNNIIEIVSKDNYKIPNNIQTQWIELNKEKMINLYLYDDREVEDNLKDDEEGKEKNENKNNSVDLKDVSLSNKINKFEKSSFEHRLDILIYILKKYHERTIMYDMKSYNDKCDKYDDNNQCGDKTSSIKYFNKKKFKLIHKYPIHKTIIFVNSIKDCIKIYNFLKKHNWPVFSFHKNLSLNSRIQNLHSFSYTHTAILITTDLISRGINIKGVDHIINFHFPLDVITYIHRLEKINSLNNNTIENYHNKNISTSTLDMKKRNDEKKQAEKQIYLVTNFISTSNYLLADSIRNYEYSNTSLLSLFSRKKSFKMKNKRKMNENTSNRYINMEKLKEIELDINDKKLISLFDVEDERDKVENNSLSDRSNKNNSYVKAPFTVFTLEDDTDDEDENVSEYKNDKYNDDIRSNGLYDKYNIWDKKEKNKSNNDIINNNSNNIYIDSTNNYPSDNLIHFKETKKESIQRNYNIPKKNNLNIPSWNDVQFDHKKYIIERFKQKECYLMNQVKRGKLILNNFESNNDEDELLF